MKLLNSACVFFTCLLSQLWLGSIENKLSSALVELDFELIGVELTDLLLPLIIIALAILLLYALGVLMDYSLAYHSTTVNFSGIIQIIHNAVDAALKKRYPSAQKVSKLAMSFARVHKIDCFSQQTVQISAAFLPFS